MTDTAHAAHVLPSSGRAWHRRILSLTWPVILANITIPLVGVADVAVMGRLPEPAYIAAVTMGAAMFSAVYWLFGFLRMGTTGLTAQAFGRRNIDEAAAIAVRAVGVALVLGIIIVAVQWPLKAGLFRLFSASAEVQTLAGSYYDIRVYGAPGLLIYLALLGTLFGLQRMRDTLVLSVGFNLTNLVLDLVLVLAFDLGVDGVAYGTVVSEWGAAAMAFALVLRGLKRLGWNGATPPNLWQRTALLRFFDIGGNLILRTFFVQLPFFVGTVVATGMGDLTLAAHGLLMQLFFIMTYSLDGFAHTAESLTGYAYGARKSHELKRATYYCGIWALGLAIATGCVYLIGGHWLIALLTVSTDVIEEAVQYLPWLALAPLFCIWAFLFDGIFIGTTYIREMRNSMMLSALVWAILLYATYEQYAYHAVWLAMNAFMLIRGILLAILFPRIVKGAT